MRYSADDHLADLEALLGSATPDELHRALVLGVPGFSRHEVSWPVRLLREVHKAEPEHVGESVVLLATDPRWKSARGLMSALAESGVVADEVLDVVAAAFVQAGEFVWWRCPGDWFGHGVAVELDDGGAVDVAASSVGDDEDSEPTVVRRRVSIDARRWAVHRLLTEDPQRWSSLLRRAADTPRTIASGLLFGLLDSADVVPGPAMRVVERAAVASSDMAVRLAGLRRLAEHDRATAATLAAADPNQRVRDWARELSRHSAPTPEPAADSPVERGVDGGVGDVQARLF